jgi:hypothetical protein
MLPIHLRIVTPSNYLTKSLMFTVILHLTTFNSETYYVI